MVGLKKHKKLKNVSNQRALISPIVSPLFTGPAVKLCRCPPGSATMKSLPARVAGCPIGTAAVADRAANGSVQAHSGSRETDLRGGVMADLSADHVRGDRVSSAHDSVR